METDGEDWVAGVACVAPFAGAASVLSVPDAGAVGVIPEDAGGVTCDAVAAGSGCAVDIGGDVLLVGVVTAAEAAPGAAAEGCPLAEGAAAGADVALSGEEEPLDALPVGALTAGEGGPGVETAGLDPGVDPALAVGPTAAVELEGAPGFEGGSDSRPERESPVEAEGGGAAGTNWAGWAGCAYTGAGEDWAYTGGGGGGAVSVTIGAVAIARVSASTAAVPGRRALGTGAP